MEFTAKEFARYLESAARRSPRETVRVVRRNSNDIKKQARRNVRQTAPIENAHAQNFINWDVEAKGVLVEGVIGYDKGGPGDLGNLLEFGGGGDHSPPHRDLARALDGQEVLAMNDLLDMGAKLLGE